ncbi:ankyrin repeat-containing domain protein [Podospora fimiseda]|uniref:Ankyrin repeat-containing domain protein n=1 Tax=Podospora fimiseda TaxID=252190 RepID=A0AAN7BY99_9PEZI|nr:ankyrin repeat-containing domain protein [Podospora fimiseda]
MGRLDIVERMYNPRELMDLDSEGRTAWHYACYHGHLDVVKYLLDKDEVLSDNPAVQDKQLAAPLILAATEGYLKIVQLLLPRLSIEELKAQFSHAVEQGLVHFMDLILKAVLKLDPSPSQDLFLSKHEYTFSEHPLTPIQTTAFQNQPRVIEFLLLHHYNYSLDEVGSDSGTTPLVLAAQNQALESMRLLLDAGASPDALNNRGRPILSVAVFLKRPAVVQLLLDYGASRRLTGYWACYENMLKFCVANSTLHVFRILLKHIKRMWKFGPAPEKVPTPEEALKITIEGDQPQMFIFCNKYLSGQYREAVEKVMQEQKAKLGSMVERAASRKSIKVFKGLYSIVFNYVDMNNTGGLIGSALQTAAVLDNKSDTIQKFEMLLANLGNRSISGTDESGHPVLNGLWGTVLHAAAWSRNRLVVTAIIDRQSSLKDQADMMGRLPLHVAAMRDDWELLQQLSTDKSTFYSTDKMKCNALHMACGLDKISVVRGILETAESPSELLRTPDVDGWTPLHWACRSSVNVDLVKFLLE